MSSRTISSFDRIIRKAEKGAPVPPNYNLFYFDEKNKHVLSKEPSFFQSVGKKIGIYLISSSETIYSDGFTFSLENGIGLNVTYAAKCTSENEAKLLTTLFDEHNSFEFCLHQKLRHFLRQFITETNDTISHNFLGNCEKYLQKKCLADTGLLLKPAISFQSEGNLKEINIKSTSFICRLQDYKYPVNIEFDISIQPDENDLEKCLLELPVADEMEYKIKEIAKTQIWENISLNQFCLYLNLPPNSINIQPEIKCVKDVLINPINTFLANFGRKIGYLHLFSTSVENIIPKNQIDIEYIGQYKIFEDNESVVVKSNVSLKLKNIAAFKKAEERYNIQNIKTDYIEEWFKLAVIAPLIKEILFNKKYKDVLLHPESIKETIKDDITKKAEEIGYAIALHTHLPDIKKLKLRDGFTIAMLDEEFETKSSDIRIKLNVTVKGKITNLDGLDESLLQPDVDIESEMKSEIRSAVEDVIHRLDPEQIYLKFSFDPENKPPVEQILNEVITQSLSKKFKVDRNSLRNVIKLSQSEDELIKKSAALRKDLRKFEFTVYPTSKDTYIESLVYEIQYKIMGVAPSGWPAFLSRISKDVDIQFNELEDFLKSLIVEKLNSIDYATLKSEDAKTKDIIKEGVDKLASALVADKFGLHISFYTFIRKRSETELKAIQTSLQIFGMEEEALIEAKKDDITNMHENIRLLRDREKQAIENEDLIGALQFRKQIEELKKANETTIPVAENIRKQIKDGKNEKNALKSLFNLPSRLLNNSTDEEVANP